MSDNNKDLHHWQFASLDLKKALDQWDELALFPMGPSPDEQKFKDMQKLIQELKIKLKEFDQKK